MRRPDATTAQAEAVALRAFNYLASDAALIGDFLAQSGLGPDTIRSAAREPGFLAGVLAFVVEDENRLIAFSDATGDRPEDVMRAHLRLSPPGLREV
jgi:hypothetical protein